MRVLVVDDSAIVRERLAATLPALVQGIEIVGKARGVREATEFALARRPDVIILDVRLPDGSGLDALRAIRCHGLTSVVLVVTTFPSPECREAALAAGANFFFSKCAGLPEMLQVLQAMAPQGAAPHIASGNAHAPHATTKGAAHVE
jgi:DNA-binding NarL/FixJ family response regulator